MNRRIRILLWGSALHVASLARGDLVIDLDPVTPGFQTSIAVPSGASVTAIVYFDPTLSGPILANGLGIDLNWTPTGAGAAVPSTPIFAGSLPGVAPPPAELDIVTGGPIAPSTPLASAGLSPGAGTFSLGGVGYVDPTGGTFTSGMGPLGFVIDIFGLSFTVSGSPGDTITFTPSGILPPGSGASAGMGPFVSGGDTWQALPGAPSSTFSGPAFSSVVTIVPEPAAATLLLIGIALIGARRHTISHVA